MNETVDKFLLVDDKFMPHMHLKQPGFTCAAVVHLPKNKERIETFMQTGNTDFIYRNKIDKTCFQHDMAYGKSKDLEIKNLKLRVIQNMTVIKED